MTLNRLKLLAVAVFLLPVFSKAASFEGEELVRKFMKTPDAAAVKVKACGPITPTNSPDYSECWGAKTAAQVMAMSPAAQEMIFDRKKLSVSQSRCRQMTYKEILESRDCKDVNAAQNFFLTLSSPKGSNFIRF